MSALRTDPLLLAGKVMAFIMQAAMAIAAIAVAITLPLILLEHAGFVTGLVKGSRVSAEKLPIGTLAALLLVALGMIAALFVFFGRLKAIIDTVGMGDPFTPANAHRLNLMAWLLLATQLLALPALVLASQVVEAAGKLDEVGIALADDGIDITGIFMVLVLFILARVFRQGAAMRADLEGTV